jgi:hypothetical protein
MELEIIVLVKKVSSTRTSIIYLPSFVETTKTETKQKNKSKIMKAKGGVLGRWMGNGERGGGIRKRNRTGEHDHGTLCTRWKHHSKFLFVEFIYTEEENEP